MSDLGDREFYVHRHIEDALSRAFEEIDRHIRSGEITDDDVVDALEKGWDEAVADAWRDYALAEGEGE